MYRGDAGEKLLGEHGQTTRRSPVDHGPRVHWTENLAVVDAAGVSRRRTMR